MADFKTHITTSSVLGVAYGTGAAVAFDVPLDQCLLATGLCSVSGMLPDIDSNHGVPLRESLAFGAAVVPMLLIDRFRNLGFTTDMMVLSGALIYLFIRFAFGYFLRHYTVHRGMFHSIPAAVIFAELTYLICDCAEENLRLFKAAAVFLGFMSHLVLDEFYSLYWYRGRLRKKKSFGTALKLWGPKLWGNISTFSKLALLTCVVFYEGEWMGHWHNHDDHRIADTRSANTPGLAGQPSQHDHQHGDPAAMQRTWMQQPEAQSPTPVRYDPNAQGYSQPAQQQPSYNNAPQGAYSTNQQQPAWPQSGYNSNYASGTQSGGYQQNGYQSGAYQQNNDQSSGYQQNSYQNGAYQTGLYPQNSYPSGGYQTSQPTSSYPSGSYPGSNYQGGQYQNGYHQGSSYQGSQYPNGNYQGGAYQNGGYQNYPSGSYPSGSYPSGNYSHGRY